MDQVTKDKKSGLDPDQHNKNVTEPEGETFKALFENAQVGIYRTTPEGKVLAANAAFIAMLGFDSFEDLAKRNLENEGFSPETPRSKFKELIELEGEVRNLESQWTKKDGSLIYVSENARVMRNGDNEVCFYEGTVLDISDRKKTEKWQSATYEISQAAILTENLEDLYKAIHQILSRLMPVQNFFIALLDEASNTIHFPYYKDQFDEPPHPIKAGKGLTGYVMRTQKTLFAPPEVFTQLMNQGEVELVGSNSVDWLGVPLISKDRTIGAMVTQSYTEGVRFNQSHADMLTFVSTQVAMAIESKRSNEKIRRQAERLSLLNTIAKALSSTLNLDDLLEIVHQEIDKAVISDAFFIALYDQRREVLDFKISIDKGKRETPYTQPLGEGLSANVVRTRKPILITDFENEKEHLDKAVLWGSMDLPSSWLGVPILFKEQVLGVISVQKYNSHAYSNVEVELLSTIADEVAVAIINSRMYTAEIRRATRITEIARLGSQLTSIRDVGTLLNTLVTRAAEIMESTTCTVMLINQGRDLAVLEAQVGLPSDTPARLKVPLSLPIIKNSIETREPIILEDIDRDGPMFRGVLVNKQIKAFFAYPMVMDEITIGFLTLSKEMEYLPSIEEIRSSQLLAERATIAMENARLFEETIHNLKQVEALHMIDMAITSSVDLKFILDILLEKARVQLNVDAVAVLIFDLGTQLLNFAAGSGFRTNALQGTHLMLGQSYAGMAGLTKKMVHVENMRVHKTDFLRSPFFSSEEFEEYYGIPLIAKGEIKGVLEIFQRGKFNAAPDWMSFLDAFSGQAAIAIDNAQLVDNLKRTNSSLMLAYDSTIMGWSNAMDMRDKETEGHTQRVTKVTMRLAQAMGVGEEALVHIRRGSLLHDIGKMAIPDEILLKPGPLTDEEWVEMRKHPVYARQLLSTISYLQAALSIPYYHHENWDGSGYPDGIKGETIPLEARIFAVVDVWDALRSKRRYRDAWPDNKVRTFIRDQAGKRFDPRVVDVFDHLITTEPLISAMTDQ